MDRRSSFSFAQGIIASETVPIGTVASELLMERHVEYISGIWFRKHEHIRGFTLAG